MISNKRQYLTTRKHIQNFEQKITELNQDNPSDKLHLDSFQSTLEELQEEVQEYEKIKAGEVKQLKIDEFSQIPEILIKARIARGWTQEQLVEKLGLKPQQIQRYEATFYESASFTRILEVIDALGLKITGEVSLQ